MGIFVERHCEGDWLMVLGLHGGTLRMSYAEGNQSRHRSTKGKDTKIISTCFSFR